MDTPLNVVVVEDHDALRAVTVEALRSIGCAATGVASGEEVVDGVGAAVDLFVIDLNLPGEDGLSLSRRIRAAQPDIGIIMVTARRQLDDKVVGYESGADLYLTKPTSIPELAAAVQALGRRLRRENRRQWPALVLDTVGLSLAGPENGPTIPLAAHEVALLAAMIRAPERRVETWQLMEISGGEDSAMSKATLEVQIVRLRKKLVAAGAAEPAIKAIRGVGYQLCTAVSIA